MEENSIELLNMGCELEWENSFLVREFNNINKMIPQKEVAFCDFKKRYIDNWKLGNRGKMFVKEEEKEFNELMEKSTLDKIPFFTISSENIWVNFFNKLSKKELFEFCTHYIYTQSVYVDIIVVAWNLYFKKFFPPNKKELQIFSNFLFTYGWYDEDKRVQLCIKNNNYIEVLKISEQIKYYSITLTSN